MQSLLYLLSIYVISRLCYILYASMVYKESVIFSMYTMLYTDSVISIYAIYKIFYVQCLCMFYLECIYVIPSVYLYYISRICYSLCLSMHYIKSVMYRLFYIYDLLYLGCVISMICYIYDLLYLGSVKSRMFFSRFCYTQTLLYLVIECLIIL